jgi:hypothetical protein
MPGGQMDVADIMVYGVVSEFEPEAGGMAFSSFMPRMGMSVRQSTKFSEMAIDVRAVEVRSGRVLVAQRIPGTAHSYSAGVGARISAGAFPCRWAWARIATPPWNWPSGIASRRPRISSSIRYPRIISATPEWGKADPEHDKERDDAHKD